MTAPITALYAALLAIFLVVLGGLVVRMRIKERIAIGDGGNKAMLAAIRVHANAVENIPIALLLMLLLEMNGGSIWWLHAFGEALIVGRLMHAFGLFQKKNINYWRQLGMVITWLVTTGLAFMLLAQLIIGL